MWPKIIVPVVLSVMLTGCGGGGSGTTLPNDRTDEFIQVRQIVLDQCMEIGEYYEIDDSRWGNTMGENYVEVFINQGNGTYWIVAIVWNDGNTLIEMRPMDTEYLYLGNRYVDLGSIAEKLDDYPSRW
jgi:hypothetical protein